VAGSDTQQGPPPPPPPPSGSPFGRFLTSPVLLVGVLALVVGAATLSYVGGDDGGVGSGSPVPSPTSTPGATTTLAGRWEGEATIVGGEAVRVRLSLQTDGSGLMRRGRCAGSLAPTSVARDAAILAYTEARGRGSCPRQTEVSIALAGDGRLRFEERESGGRPYAAGTLRR
jgi:hypothetical protein